MGINKVAVFGSTGAQGSPVVRELLSKGIEVRAVARSTDKVKAFFGSKVEAAAVDLTDTDSVRAVLSGVDGAFFHLPLLAGPEDRNRQLAIVLDAALREELPKFVFTTSGFTDPLLAGSRMVSGNIRAESAVLSSGVPSVVLKPTVYLENLLQPHALNEIINKGTLTYPIRPATRKISWTALDDQAKIAVAALQRDDVFGKSFYIASPGPLSGIELASSLSSAVGRQVEYISQDPAEFGKSLSSIFGEDIATAVSEMYEEAERQDEHWGVIDTDPVTSLINVHLKPAYEWISERDWERELEPEKSLSV